MTKPKPKRVSDLEAFNSALDKFYPNNTGRHYKRWRAWEWSNDISGYMFRAGIRHARREGK